MAGGGSNFKFCIKLILSYIKLIQLLIDLITLLNEFCWVINIILGLSWRNLLNNGLNLVVNKIYSFIVGKN